MWKILVRVAVTTATLSLALACVAGFLIHWTVDSPALRERLLHDFETSSGLHVEAAGPMSIVLLPRPTVRLRTVSMTGGDGAVSLDARAVTASLALQALLEGRARILVTTLEEPTLVVDLDRLLALIQPMAQPPSPGSAAAPSSLLALLRTDGLSLRGGTIRMLSHNPVFDMLFTDLKATWTWPADGGGASLTGEATWHGRHGAVTAMVDAPQALFDGESSAAYLRVRCDLIDLQADGTLWAKGDGRSFGAISASTPALPLFLRSIGTPFPGLDRISEARLSGKWSLAQGMLALDESRLELDDMLFEGAMAFNERGGHPGLSGTLATDHIDLDPFLEALPNPQASDGSWSSAILGTKEVAFDDIDLRISATSAKMGPIEFQDGGLSLQSGGGRMEISLGEARAYDGLLKGRIVAQVDGDKTDVRAEANVSQLNLSGLAKKLDLGGQITGTSTAYAILEGSGDTPRALIDSVTGRGQFSVRDGQLGPNLLARFIPAGTDPGVPVPTLPRGRIPFDSTTLGFDVRQGIATLDEGWLTHSDLRTILHGSASLPDQSVDLTASVVPLGDDVAADADPQVRLSGPWRDIRLSAIPPRLGALPGVSAPAPGQ